MESVAVNKFLELMDVIYRNNHDGQLNPDLIKPYLSSNILLRVVPKGVYIIREDEKLNKVYFVVSGQYYSFGNSLSGKINMMGMWKAPQFIGIDRAVDGAVASVSSVVTLRECIILEVNQEFFLKCIKTNGDIALRIIADLCKKLTSSNGRITRLTVNDSNQNLLIYIYGYFTENWNGQGECKLELKNSLIAHDIGISERTLYRLVNKLKSEELINVKQGCIVVTKEQIKRIKSNINTE